MPSIYHNKDLRKELLTKIISNFNLDILHCSKYEKNYNERIAVYLIKLIVNHWCTEINRILTEKRQIRCGETNPIMKLANIWNSKHKKPSKIIQGKF